jgi:hypothetical protein
MPVTAMTFWTALGPIVLALALLPPAARSAGTEVDLTAAETRAIAKEATIYGFPLVDNYRILHSFAVGQGGKEFKAPWNQLHNEPRVFTSKDRTVQTPNSDTPYSFLAVDLRAEPLVLSVPEVEKGRYYSLQFIDLYTFNYHYVGSRTTGNSAGRFLLAGPDWKGETPGGITALIRSETELGVILYRTQLFAPDDIEAVKTVQAGYQVQPLSAYLGRAARTAPPIEFLAPLTPEAQRTSVAFFGILDFALRFCPTDPSEKELRSRFARLGIGGDAAFDPAKLTPEIREAFQQGMADAWAEFGEFKKTQVDTGTITSAQVFGTRDFLKNNYLYRMAGAVLGIYGNSAEEAIYPIFTVDADGQRLDASKHRYTLRFAPDQLPPVRAFWSLTMYELPGSFLVANPLNRYLINSPMLSGLKRDADGGLTLYLQHDSPGKDRESNWLPAPPGPFLAVLRLYWPEPAVFQGGWKVPALRKVADRPRG